MLTADRKLARPATRAWSWRSRSTAATPGVSATAVATAAGNPWKLSDCTTTSAVIASVTTEASEALTEAPRMPTAVTRASPIISAAAVEAVRRGLRMAFNRPSRPGTPRASGPPTTRATGRASSGDRPATPRKVSRAPTPTSTI